MLRLRLRIARINPIEAATPQHKNGFLRKLRKPNAPPALRATPLRAGKVGSADGKEESILYLRPQFVAVEQIDVEVRKEQGREIYLLYPILMQPEIGSRSRLRTPAEMTCSLISA